MSELLKAFDSYNDFNGTAYFTLCYNVISSDLLLKIPLVANKNNLKFVLDELKLDSTQFELVFKNWTTEDTRNSDLNKDYPYKQLYKGIDKACIVWIRLEDDVLDIEFLYDCKHSEIEEWVIQKNHVLRNKFGLDNMPKFKVLTKKHNHFETESVRTEHITIDIKGNYNDDFQTVHEKIKTSITSKKSGLILLHGVPGTGKTTYIKHLISQHHELNFIFIQNEFINHLLEPDFISFLLKQRNAILIIEDAEKVLTSREYIKESSVVSTILQLTDGLFSDYLNIKVICTFNINMSKIDSALLRKGRMIAIYDFKLLTVEKTNHLLAKIGIKSQNKAMTISDIYNYKEENFNTINSIQKIGFKTKTKY